MGWVAVDGTYFTKPDEPGLLCCGFVGGTSFLCVTFEEVSLVEISEDFCSS